MMKMSWLCSVEREHFTVLIFLGRRKYKINRVEEETPREGADERENE